MNVLSLFDGMSCGQIALNKIGIEYDNYYASEIDKYAIKVTQKNYPNTIQLGSVVDVSGSDLPKIDLLIGGSPCQGFSFAGKQLNFEDERSKLFFEYVRILKETKPKYFLLENVKMKKEYQDVISSALGVEPILINSNLVSAQERKRLYWTNISNITQPENKYIYLKDIIENGTIDRDKSYCLTAKYTNRNSQWKLHKQYFIKRQEQVVILPEGSFRSLSPLECERLQNVPNNYTNCVSNSQRYKMLGNGWTVDVVAHIFSFMKNIEDNPISDDNVPII